MNSKFNEAKEKLITAAQRIAGTYLLNRYGSAHLIGSPKVELTSTIDPDSSSLLFQGRITVYATPEGFLSNQVGVNMTVNSNDIEIEGTEDVEATIEQALNSAENQPETVVAALDGFKFVNDGSKYLQVTHASLAEATIGVVGQAEYETSKDKVSLLKSIVKDAFPQTKITFEGSFVEPVIEKVAEGEETFPHARWCQCKECQEKKEELPGELATPKKSWLTAAISKEARGPFFQELSSEKQQEIIDAVAEHFAEGGLRGQELDEEIDNFINIHNDGDSLAAISEGRWMELEAAKVAIKEDMPMARMSDHLAQSIQAEEQVVTAVNEKIKTEAVNSLVVMLHGLGYGNCKIAEVSMVDNKIDAMVTLDDAGTVKAVNIPVEIKADKIVLPKKSLVASLIANGLDINAKLSEEFSKQVIERIAAEEARIQYETEEANQIIAERTGVTKTAGDEPKTQFEGTNEVVYLNKHLIPADVSDLDIGNIVHVDGISYKLVSKDKDALSKGEDDASTWVFEKVQPVAKDTPKKEVNK